MNIDINLKFLFSNDNITCIQFTCPNLSTQDALAAYNFPESQTSCCLFSIRWRRARPSCCSRHDVNKSTSFNHFQHNASDDPSRLKSCLSTVHAVSPTLIQPFPLKKYTHKQTQTHTALAFSLWFYFFRHYFSFRSHVYMYLLHCFRHILFWM